ncbi:hypothetical protein [Nocardia sp. NPDC058114]|uniref:hypothetical protein n=1 Tax=Nocardia sp. NPDC058114 TaxID=3346346 RepID=UPI0036D88619
MSDPARYPTAHQGRTFHQLPVRPQQSSGGWIVAAVLVIVGGPGITLAVGQDLGSALAGPILLGIAILIVTLIRRSRAQRPPASGFRPAMPPSI